MIAVIYTIATGQILRTVACPAEMLALQFKAETEGCLENEQADDALSYVLDGTITPRPEFAETITGTTISNLPNPTTIKTNGQTYTVPDGTAELTYSQPGTYRVRLAGFPYQDKVVEVTQP
jgi:hypothetical protein